ncbi:MAG: glycoside hydrolase family protein, partial [Oligoflexia bacterium]|nr:glycoside hydrolase family protein [Oligoflexia bacterium]
ITLDIATNAANYVEVLQRSYALSREFAPGKLVVSAATTAINQNYPESLDYNRAMRDAGLRSYADVYGVHYYGKQYENLVRNGGVADYLNGLGLPIWVTESGAQGVTEQLGYVEEVWPFLSERVDNIQRFYYYQFAEDAASANTYGLRNLDPGASISDLYVYLRDKE